MFQQFKPATKYKAPDLTGAAIQQGILDMEAEQMQQARAAETRGALIGAGGTYNRWAEKNGKTYIADALREAGIMSPETPPQGSGFNFDNSRDIDTYNQNQEAAGLAPQGFETETTVPEVQTTGMEASPDAISTLRDDLSVAMDSGDAAGAVGGSAEAVDAADGAMETVGAVDDVTGAVDAASAGSEALSLGGGGTAGLGDLLEGDIGSAVAKQALARSLAMLGPYGALAGALLGSFA